MAGFSMDYVARGGHKNMPPEGSNKADSQQVAGGCSGGLRPPKAPVSANSVARNRRYSHSRISHGHSDTLLGSCKFAFDVVDQPATRDEVLHKGREGRGLKGALLRYVNNFARVKVH